MQELDLLLNAILSGNATPHQLGAFKEWFETDEINQHYFVRYKKFWNATHGIQLSSKEVEFHYNQVVSQLSNYESITDFSEVDLPPHQTSEVVSKENSRAFTRHIFSPTPHPLPNRNSVRCLWRRHVASGRVAIVAGLLIATAAAWSIYRTSLRPRYPLPADLVAYTEPAVTDSSATYLSLADGHKIDLSQDNVPVRIDPETANGLEIRFTRDDEMFYTLPQTHLQLLKKPVYHTLHVPAGSRYTVTLADGTKVWVNSETTLSYPPQFTENARYVILSGQACFEVAKDPEKRPFIVLTRDLIVQSISTLFDVCAYGAESQAGMTLVEGRVAVKAQGREYICEAGTRLTLQRASRRITTETVDAPYLTAWRNELLAVDNLRFRDMVHRLEIWYGRRIHTELPQFDDYIFHGEFNRADLSTALETLRINLGLHYEIRNNEIFLTSNPKNK